MSQPERIVGISEVFNAVIQDNIQQRVKADKFMMKLVSKSNSRFRNLANLERPSSPLQHPTALPPTRELDPDLLVHELAQVQDGFLLLPLWLVPCRSLAWSRRHPDPDAGTLKMAPHTRRWQGSNGRKKQRSFIATLTS